jgi:hypothetical protein
MKPQMLLAVGILIGLMMIPISYAVPSLLGGSGWTEQDADELALLGRELHAASFSRYAKSESDDHGHGHSHGEVTRSYDEIEKEFNAKNAKLEGAQQSGTGLAAAFYWLGIVTALGCGVGYFVVGGLKE